MTKAIKRATRRIERELAVELGGRTLFNSGAGDDKADVVVTPKVTLDTNGVPHFSGGGLRVESKVTSKTTYALSQNTWLKTRQAARGGETPVMQIITNVRRLFHYEWAVMPYPIAAPLLGIDIPPHEKGLGCRSFSLVHSDRRKADIYRVVFDNRDDVLIFPWAACVSRVLPELV